MPRRVRPATSGPRCATPVLCPPCRLIKTTGPRPPIFILIAGCPQLGAQPRRLGLLLGRGRVLTVLSEQHMCPAQYNREQDSPAVGSAPAPAKFRRPVIATDLNYIFHIPSRNVNPSVSPHLQFICQTSSAEFGRDLRP